MNFEDHYSLNLGLALPSSSSTLKPNNPNLHNHTSGPKSNHSMLGADPCLTLTLSSMKAAEEPPCSGSAASSIISNAAVSVKRERESSSYDDVDLEDEDGTCHVTTAATRKKLRLTKDQSAMLEESFKLHTTLNPKQKQALADRLNLRPRQVEVWFQNRRARTKLKQTEVECEYMKKWVETLRDENKRLQKEVEELKALKVGKPPLYMNLLPGPGPGAALSMCPSCERMGATPAMPASHFYTTTAAPNRPLLVRNN